MKASSCASFPAFTARDELRWGVRARQILLPGGRLLDDGCVWGGGDARIHGVAGWAEARRAGLLPPRSALHDLGDALLLPGLINAHCHLELSGLRGAIPPGLPFPSWLLAMVEATRGKPVAYFSDASRKGVRELRQAGCVYVADIVRRGPFPPPVAESLPAMGFRLYRELIEFSEERAARAVEEALDWCDEARAPGIEPGLSPHAPYTTTLPLLQEAASAAERRKLPICVHCDETEEEHRLWLRGDGPLGEVLREFGVIAEGWRTPGCTPVEWLERAGLLPDPQSGRPAALLAHLNAATDSDLQLLACRGAAAVVCPGTHRYFGREAFPLRRLLNAGVPTALGTDGLSSNDRLSMWEEIRRAADLTPGLSAAHAIGLATSLAAQALGLAGEYGEIEAGRRAAFCVVASPRPAVDLDAAPGLDWLHSPETTVLESVVFQ